MKDLIVLLIHLMATLAKLMGPGGVKAVFADSLLLKQQLLVLNRSRQRAPIAEIPVDRVRQVFEVNAFSTLDLAQAFARFFAKKGKGKIIFTSSIVGFSTFPYLAPYCASKHALEAIVQLMREEMEGTCVQIAKINPGPFRTGFNDRMYDTLDQWYEPGKNFTQEKPIRDIQARFSGDELQLDPQALIDTMVEIIPAEHHKFRTVFPESFVESCKEYQNKQWDAEI